MDTKSSKPFTCIRVTNLANKSSNFNKNTTRTYERYTKQLLVL